MGQHGKAMAIGIVGLGAELLGQELFFEARS
jgi:hypothetical protein